MLFILFSLFFPFLLTFSLVEIELGESRKLYKELELELDFDEEENLDQSQRFR